MKFIALSAYIKKSERAQVNDATQALENRGQTKSRSSRWQKIIKIKAEINEIKHSEQYKNQWSLESVL